MHTNSLAFSVIEVGLALQAVEFRALHPAALLPWATTDGRGRTPPPATQILARLA